VRLSFRGPQTRITARRAQHKGAQVPLDLFPELNAMHPDQKVQSAPGQLVQNAICKPQGKLSH